MKLGIFKKPLKKIQYLYEIEVAPFLALYFKWLFLPLYWILRINKIKLVWNIHGSTGHTIIELDYYFHIKKEGTKYLWVKKPDPFCRDAMEIYRDHFWSARSSFLLYHILLPLALGFPDLLLDCGQARVKWLIDCGPDKIAFDKRASGQTCLCQVSKKRGQGIMVDYFKKKSEHFNYYPLLSGKFNEKEVDDFLKNNCKPLALIHYKQTVVNATASPIDPLTYLEALEYLVNVGFQLVLFGRESMPSCFQKLAILNYGQSPIASFKNDIILTKRAKLAITAGSGISQLPDCLDVSYLYANSWHIPRPQYSPKCIIIPSLVRKRKGEKFLKFHEQKTLYETIPDVGAEMFPQDQYEGRNATSDELLEGVKELLNPNKELTSLQKKYKNLDPEGPLGVTKARCSQYFLEKHKDLLENV